MATYVLVHGAFHGAWCWTKLTPELEARGHRAVAFDLPGGGEDKTPIEQVTLDAYVERVVETVAQESERVILVGHSLGGIIRDGCSGADSGSASSPHLSLRLHPA